MMNVSEWDRRGDATPQTTTSASSMVAKMTDQELQACWNALPSGVVDESMRVVNGVPFSRWAELVYVEMCMRELAR